MSRRHWFKEYLALTNTAGESWLNIAINCAVLKFIIAQFRKN